MTMQAAREVVAKGARLLDEKLPGWWARIDLDLLDVHDSTDCVLGQLYPQSQKIPVWRAYNYASLDAAIASGTFLGNERFYSQLVCNANYALGVALLLPGQRVLASHYGFNDGSDTSFEELDEAWKEIVLARQQVTADGQS